MQNAVPNGEGGMLAVLGSNVETIEKILEDNQNNFKVEIANDNSNGQLVLSGKNFDLEKLIILRKKLDSLDNKLLKIIKKRYKVVQNVLSLKEKKSEIIDKKRINIILKNIKIKSKKNNIDVNITNKIWKSMISAFINYEYRNFKKK